MQNFHVLFHLLPLFRSVCLCLRSEVRETRYMDVPCSCSWPISKFGVEGIPLFLSLSFALQLVGIFSWQQEARIPSLSENGSLKVQNILHEFELQSLVGTSR